MLPELPDLSDERSPPGLLLAAMAQWAVAIASMCASLHVYGASPWVPSGVLLQMLPPPFAPGPWSKLSTDFPVARLMYAATYSERFTSGLATPKPSHFTPSPDCIENMWLKPAKPSPFGIARYTLSSATTFASELSPPG